MSRRERESPPRRAPTTGSHQISTAGVTTQDSRDEVVLVESLGTVMTLAEFREAVDEVVRWAES